MTRLAHLIKIEVIQDEDQRVLLRIYADATQERTQS
jgi:hypothetical protein